MPLGNATDLSYCFLPCGLHTEKDPSFFVESFLLENIATSCLFWGMFHFASTMREKEKLYCDHDLKLAQALMLWLSKTLINGLNFKWTTSRTVSYASIQVCALGVLLNEDLDIRTLLKDGRKLVCARYICHQLRCIGKELQKRGSYGELNLKLQWLASKLSFFHPGWPMARRKDC